MSATRQHTDWRDLDDAELMQMRVRQLGLRIEGSELEPMVHRLYDELASKGLTFRPPCYLADEWLCPDRDPIIGIPFYLADRRLKRLEQKIMFEVEGGTEKTCMQLLRHECGHAINYAYEFFKRTRWRELFGPFSATYSNHYEYQPYSRRFVIHLENNYAQSHPDEDFAETFATWLTPDIDWPQRYRNWPVMKKLRYVDALMQKCADKPPVVTARKNPPWSASRMTSTLESFYDRKRRVLGKEFRGYYDDSLTELFGDRTTGQKASKLLRKHRRLIVENVTRWTGHRKYDIHQLVNRLAVRCDELELKANRDDMSPVLGLTAMLTAVASNTYRVERRP